MGMERRLAVVLSADVQGYSRLMYEDETATIRTLTAYRGLMAALIRQYRGRVVDDPGDNLLAEFPSAVEAVQCAVTIQRTLATRNAALPPQRQMVFRMGLHVGISAGAGTHLRDGSQPGSAPGTRRRGGWPVYFGYRV